MCRSLAAKSTRGRPRTRPREGGATTRHVLAVLPAAQTRPGQQSDRVSLQPEPTEHPERQGKRHFFISLQDEAHYSVRRLAESARVLGRRPGSHRLREAPPGDEHGEGDATTPGQSSEHCHGGRLREAQVHR